MLTTAARKTTEHLRLSFNFRLLEKQTPFDTVLDRTF